MSSDESNSSSRPPQIRKDIFLPLLSLGAMIAFLFFVYLGRARNEKQTEALSGTYVDIKAEFDESLYAKKYANVDHLINGLEYDAALNALDRISTDTSHDLFIRGILMAWIGQDEKSASLLTQAAKWVPLPAASPMLMRYQAEWNLKPDVVNSAVFTTEDSQYLRRCHFLQCIADRLVAGCVTDREKVEKLLEWVFLHVAFWEPDVINVGAVDVLLRGFGLCDRSAWVLSLLCDRAGLDSAVVLLGEPEIASATQTTVQPSHTLCEVCASDQWLLCDTVQGSLVMFEDRSEPATLVSIRQRLFAEPDNVPLKEQFKRYLYAGVGATCQAEGVLPRFQLLESYIRILPPHPSVYVDPDRLQQMVTESVTLEDGTATNPTGIWDYPFHSFVSYRDPAFLKRREEAHANLLTYQNARILQLLGHPIEALQAYLKASENCSPSAAEDILYFMAQCHYETGNSANAEKSLSIYIQKYPHGRWRTYALYQLARVEEEMKKLEIAARLYRAIDSFRIARMRAELIESKLSLPTLNSR